jgi:hypothetical protein
MPTDLDDDFFNEDVEVFNRVRSYKWVRGVLRFRDYFFKNIDDAVNFANSVDVQNAKVFDTSGKMIYQVVDPGGGDY